MNWITLFPPEVTTQILESVGFGPNSGVYSEKERQNDLVAFSQVGSRPLHKQAQRLLYASPSIRNAGRAALYRRSMWNNPPLALIARKLRWSGLPVMSELPGDIIDLLKNVADYELENWFFSIVDDPRIESILVQRANVVALKISGSGWIAETTIALLNAWTGLKSLQLGHGRFVLSTNEDLQTTFCLTESRLVGCDLTLCGRGFVDVLSGDQTKYLEWNDVTIGDRDGPYAKSYNDDLLPMFAKAGKSLIRFTYLKSTTSPTEQDLNKILATMPHLQELELDDTTTSPTILSSLKTCSSLRTLVLGGARIGEKVQLASLISAGQFPSLRNVVLLVAVRTAPDIWPITEACRSKDISL